MNKKYYADINLYFDTMKYSITGYSGLKKIELIELVKAFAKQHKFTCNIKTKKFFNSEGKEVGSYNIISTES